MTRAKIKSRVLNRLRHPGALPLPNFKILMTSCLSILVIALYDQQLRVFSSNSAHFFVRHRSTLHTPFPFLSSFIISLLRIQKDKHLFSHLKIPLFCSDSWRKNWVASKCLGWQKSFISSGTLTTSFRSITALRPQELCYISRSLWASQRRIQQRPPLCFLSFPLVSFSFVLVFLSFSMVGRCMCTCVCGYCSA